MQVPHEVGEQAFWADFFKSQLLGLGKNPQTTRGSGGGGSGGGALAGGLFAAVGNSDDAPVARTASEVNAVSNGVDPTVDLVSVYGDYVADPV